ncbi:MAG: class I SAM-dependent methyltransferase [Vicingaceae bacterium]
MDYVNHQVVEILQCEACHLTYSDYSKKEVLSSDQQEKEKYQSGAYHTEESFLHRLLNPFILFLEKGKLSYFNRQVNGKKLLEIGCGKGNLLLVANQRGAKACGIDINLRVKKEVKEQAIELIETDVNGLVKQNRKFDLLILWHVLEHIPNVKQFYNDLHHICHKESEIIIAVPNEKSWQHRLTGAKWYHLDPNRHLYHFNINTLKKELSNAQFKVENVSYHSFYQNFIGDYISVANILFKIKNLSFNLVRSRKYLETNFGKLRVYTETLLFIMYTLILIIPLLLFTFLSQVFKRSGTMVLRVKAK